jgi:riboflavin kinase/FMN adenylyltransferase
MRVVRGLDRYPVDAGPCVVAQGTFDGVHRGHQQVIATAVARARALGVPPVAVTFDPLPVTVLRPAEAPPEILSLDDRLDRIAGGGVAVALVISFTPAFASVEADAYVRDVLVRLLSAREVVVGFNHTFGRGAQGTPDLLRSLGVERGFQVHVVEPLALDGVVVSSSAVRDALRQGDAATAGGLLGRPYAVTGPVGHGAGRGRTLGFPTANVETERPVLLADGVYAAWATWDGGRADAVVNIGVRPTFDEGRRAVEAHLLDRAPDLYGRRLTLEFLARIRAETRFPSVDALRARIAEDLREARQYLAAHPAPP